MFPQIKKTLTISDTLFRFYQKKSQNSILCLIWKVLLVMEVDSCGTADSTI
jgi:hypothetical protein